MAKNSKTSLDDVLFKPLVVKNDTDPRLIVIYSIDTKTGKAISATGQTITSTVTTIDIIDITSTLKAGRPVTDSWTVTDAKKFKNMFIIPAIEEYEEELEFATNIVDSEFQELGAKLQNAAKAVTALKYILPDETDHAAALIIGTSENNGLAQIVFKTVTGDVAKLNNEQVEKIGGVIMDVIMSNVATNLDDQDVLRKLKAEVNYKLIEALPDNMKAEDVHINMDSFVEEIKKFQGDTEGN